MWEWHQGAGWGWGWVWMIVIMAIVWVPLVIAFVWFVRAATEHRGERPATPAEPPARSELDLDAREIARRAYARGDLDRERFLQIMADLGGATPPPPGGSGEPPTGPGAGAGGTPA